MIKLIFDNGELSERSIMVSNYHERPLNNSFSAAYSAIIAKPEDVPVIPDFGADPNFDTVEAVNGNGVKMPLHGDYNRIVDFFTTYDDDSKRYGVNISLGYVAEGQNE